MSGIDLIADERHEQIVKHERSLEYDVKNNADGQMGFAIVSLCSQYDVKGAEGNEEDRIKHFEKWRPLGWDPELWMRMIKKPYKERLVLAGALAAAEIDRLQNIIESNVIS